VNRLDAVALMVGLIGLGLALFIQFRGPLRTSVLGAEPSRARPTLVVVAAAPGYAPLLPRLVGRKQTTRLGVARVVEVNQAEGTARFEVEAREEANGRLSYGSRLLRAGETFYFQNDDLLYSGLILSVEVAP